jgi:hypothetical protein
MQCIKHCNAMKMPLCTQAPKIPENSDIFHDM